MTRSEGRGNIPARALTWPFVRRRASLVGLLVLSTLACRGEQLLETPEPVAKPLELASLDTPPAEIAYDDASEERRWEVAYDWLDELGEQVEARAAGSEGGPGCAPPEQAQLEAAERALADFVILELRKGELRARAPKASELADLAYFYASFDRASFDDTAVGSQERTEESCEAASAELEQAREALHGAGERADYDGDVSAAIAARRAYLDSFGYPGALRRCEETREAWGGMGVDYALRELAVLLEHEGEFEEAERLYRRANPGGGVCGTSNGARQAEQIRGALRTGERARGCRAVLPERLARVVSFDDYDYGPAPLAAAGFDVVRLYRGALLTANRGGELAALEAAIDRAPAKLREAARVRLAREGREDWARRVRAIPGLATALGRAAEAELLAAWPRWGAEEREAAVTAIGQLVERLDMGDCSGGMSFRGGSLSSAWAEVPNIGHSCEERLSDVEAEALAAKLERGLGDEDAGVREATVHALHQVLATRSLAVLAELSQDDPYIDPAQRYCDNGAGEVYWSDDADDPYCRPIYPVRDAASEAHAWIAGGWAED